MSNDIEISVSRRKILGGGAAALGLSAIGGAAHMYESSQPAFAMEDLSWTSNDVAVDSPDGTVTKVYLPSGTTTATASWENYTEATATFTISARLDENAYEEIYSADFFIDTPFATDYDLVDDPDDRWGGDTSGGIGSTSIQNPFKQDLRFTEADNISNVDFQNLLDGEEDPDPVPVDVKLEFNYVHGTETQELTFEVAVNNLAAGADTSGTLNPDADVPTNE